MKKIAIYSRKSSETSKNQMEICKDYIASNFQNANILTYEDVAAGHGTNRPMLEELLRDAEKGVFDTLIFSSMDRLSRDMEEVLVILDKLNNSNITIVDVSGGYDSFKPTDLMRNITDSMRNLI